MQVAQQMSHQIPLDIVAIIIDYAAEDVTTLKTLTLTSRDFCMLSQAHIFSTVLLDGSAKRDRLIFFEDLLNGDRGQIIAGYIRNLYLLFCDDWFAEEEEEDIGLAHELGHGETNDSEQELAEREQVPSEYSSMADDNTSELAFGTMIEFIAKHAGGLRCIHIGPFSEIHLDWHDISDNVRNAITHLLVCAEDIALESFVNIPIRFFQSLQNVKSLDVAHVIPSGSSYAPPPPSIPSLTSLAIHPGINGFSSNPENMWDMTSFLRNMTLGALLDFSKLNTLYLHLLDDPNKYPMIKTLLALCANSLRTLRLYIWESHNYDTTVVDFSQLPALQSLTLVTDLSGVRSSMKYLSEAVNTIGTQKLNDLRLAIDTEDRFRDWTIELTLVMQSTPPDPWEALLRTKISEISRESNVRVAFECPPWPLPRPFLQPEEVVNAIGHIFDVDNMESAVKERMMFGIQEASIKNAFTLRTEAEIRSANASAPGPPLFGNSPYYGWNMFADNTEAPVEGDDETIPE